MSYERQDRDHLNLCRQAILFRIVHISQLPRMGSSNQFSDRTRGPDFKVQSSQAFKSGILTGFMAAAWLAHVCC